jgi:hypothetical protein
MANLLQLRQTVADATEIPLADLDANIIKPLRLAGLLPFGVPGRGGTGSPVIGTDHAVTIMLALLSSEQPHRLAQAVERIADYRLFDARQLLLGPSGIAALSAIDTARFLDGALTLGQALRSAIDEQRQVYPVAAIPVSIEAGRRWGREAAILHVAAINCDAAGARLATELTFLGPDAPPFIPATDAAKAPLSRITAIGGNILTRVAKLLGPLTAGGGGGERIELPDDPAIADNDLPLAAAGAH